MPLYTVLLSTFICFCLCNGAPSGSPKGDADRLKLKIIKHQPCNSKPTATERIRFPNLKDAPLSADPKRGDGCYLIAGKVSVLQPISGEVQIYAETKYGTSGEPAKCENYNKTDHCGGVGSCVYCNVCQDLKSVESKTKGLVRLESSDTSLQCGKTLEAKDYNNVRISFCMPTKEELKQSQNLDDELADEAFKEGRTFFVTLYIFNKKVNQLSPEKLQKIATPSSDQIIGCHRLVGKIEPS